MNPNASIAARRKVALVGQAGVGLVEVLVTVTIGLVIIAAMVALFLGTSRNNREMASANSMIENGRFALALLREDIVHGGYLGAFVPEFDNTTLTGKPLDAPSDVPDPCADYATWDPTYVNNILGIPIQTYDTVSDCSALIEFPVAASDIVVVRHAETCVTGEAGCDVAIDNRLYLQSSQCGTDPAPARRVGLFGEEDFEQLHKRDCTTLADLHRVLSHVYYVRDYAVTAGDGIPTLVRMELDTVGAATKPSHQAPVPLVEGVDVLRVELGVDDVSQTGDPVDYSAAIDWKDPNDRTIAANRGDAIPDGDFVRCTDGAPCTADQLTNVTSVRLWVLARSREETRGYVDTKVYSLGAAGDVGPFNDGFKRHVYSTTIRLPNVAGRRERP